MNLPWVESPFFEDELNNRKSLSNKDKEDAQFYHQNGYLILENVFDKEFIDRTRNNLTDNFDNRFSKTEPRVMNLWPESPEVKEIATNQIINDKLKMLYEREPIPFQTLNFKYGSRQQPHSDTIHFSSFPQRYMCAAWVALEDMDEHNGTVVYYPKSHKFNIYGYEDLIPDFNTAKETSDSLYVNRYEPFIKDLMEAKGLETKVLRVKKGDVLIWSSNLIHGGLPVQDESRTRWSQVTHYFFDNCLYYTPQLSNAVSGEWFLRKIQNIKTGKFTWGSYNGYKVKRKAVPGYKYLISDYASKNIRDIRFAFTRIYHRLLK